MAFTILPLKGFDQVEFGMGKQQARSLMRTSPEEFKRGNEKIPSDFFVQENVFFYYDEEGDLEAIEFARGAQIFLDNHSIFDMDVKQCEVFLQKFDPEAAINEGGVTSHRLSLGVWVPFMNAYDDDDGDDTDEVGQIETVLIGRPGYYDFLKS